MPNDIAITSNNMNLSNKYYFRQKTNTPLVSNNNGKNELSKKQKLGIATSAFMGTAIAIAGLAKLKGYSLNPKNILKTPLKETFLAKEEYKVLKVLSIGAGSCLGGYLGGLFFDKNKENRQAKKREGLIQYVNIALPIATVSAASNMNEFVAKKMPKSLTKTDNKVLKCAGYACEIATSLAALCTGIYAGNRVSNTVNHKLFNSKDQRPVQFTDWSAHIDDLCLASRYIAADSSVTKGISRIVPLALVVPGYEIGIKRESEINKK